jgi:hypothetical protein
MEGCCFYESWSAISVSALKCADRILFERPERKKNRVKLETRPEARGARSKSGPGAAL